MILEQEPNYDTRLGLFGAITWALLPYILILSIVLVTGWMIVKQIPTWIKRWKELDGDWWSK